MHYLLAVSHARLRNLIFVGIVLCLVVLNYGAEYNLTGGESLPDIQDYVEGFVASAVQLYALLLGIVAARTLQDQLRKKTARKFVILLVVTLLTTTMDVLLEGRSSFFFSRSHIVA
jgi:glycerol uptake facilitator-like aquaporin